MIIVHLASLRNTNDHVLEADIVHDLQKATGYGRYAAVHIACEYSSATLPVSRRLAL